MKLIEETGKLKKFPLVRVVKIQFNPLFYQISSECCHQGNRRQNQLKKNGESNRLT